LKFDVLVSMVADKTSAGHAMLATGAISTFSKSSLDIGADFTLRLPSS
jgi:hypothetical protein